MLANNRCRIFSSSSLLCKNKKIKIQRNIILSVVLYGCETWSLTLREERRPRVCENRVLQRIFGPKRDEVIGEWSKLHHEALYDLYSSPNIIRMIKSRRMRWAGHVARMGVQKRCIQGFGGGNLREILYLEDPGVDERKILSGSLGTGLGVRSGSSWLRIGTGGGHL